MYGDWRRLSVVETSTSFATVQHLGTSIAVDIRAASAYEMQIAGRFAKSGSAARIRVHATRD